MVHPLPPPRHRGATTGTIIFIAVLTLTSLFLNSSTEELHSSIPLGSNLVDLTLIQNAAEKGAVCLDGSSLGYHLQRGFGFGAHSWVLHLEIYAPWCGRRHAVVPIYNKLAKHLSNIGSLIIAKMDGTTNEYPRAKEEWININNDTIHISAKALNVIWATINHSGNGSSSLFEVAA